MVKENEFFLTQIDLIKDFLFKYTDICESPDLLELGTIIKLRDFLYSEKAILTEHVRKLVMSSKV